MEILNDPDAQESRVESSEKIRSIVIFIDKPKFTYIVAARGFVFPHFILWFVDPSSTELTRRPLFGP
jgi:hypothetical protein